MKAIHSRCIAIVTALVGLGISTASQATIVTWEAQGVLTEIDRSGGLITQFGSATIGTGFTVRYTFDTDSPVTSTRLGENGGLLYNWLSAIQSSELEIGGEIFNRAMNGSLLRLRDNFAGDLNFPLPANMAVDGITLSSHVASSALDGSASYDIIFRGPEDLNLYSGSALPEDPSPLLPMLSLHTFQFMDVGNCDEVSCQQSSFLGVVNSIRRVSVPEPSTMALFVFALLGLGFVRRRAASAAR